MSRATMILHNASVLTMDDDAPRATAVALEGSRVLAVGGEALVALAGGDTKVIDAKGRTVLPGFNDSHLHIFLGAVGLSHLNLIEVQGLDALRAAVRAYAAENPDEALLCAEFTDYAILGEGVPITRQILDEILPDRPFIMTAFDNHTAWCNTAALVAGGILEGRGAAHRQRDRHGPGRAGQRGAARGGCDAAGQGAVGDRLARGAGHGHRARSRERHRGAARR